MCRITNNSIFSKNFLLVVFAYYIKLNSQDTSSPPLMRAADNKNIILLEA